MSNLFSLSDLNTTINHEPRIRDLHLAEKLGMKNTHDIRNAIERNREELEAYGPISAATRMVITGSGARRKVNEYYLNEGQCILLCMYSRTTNAAKVRKAVIEVFMAYRRGELSPIKNIPEGYTAVKPHVRRIAKAKVVEPPKPITIGDAKHLADTQADWVGGPDTARNVAALAGLVDVLWKDVWHFKRFAETMSCIYEDGTTPLAEMSKSYAAGLVAPAPAQTVLALTHTTQRRCAA